MAAPRFDWPDPLVGALAELVAAAASLTPGADKPAWLEADEQTASAIRGIQPAHARDHVICAAELVKRALVRQTASQPAPEAQRVTEAWEVGL